MFYRLYFLGERKMNDYLVKAIDKTKNLRLITVNAKELVSEAQKRHDTWSASSAVLGRTLIGGFIGGLIER